MSIEPITRLQRFLRVLADSSADMPEPLRDLGKCCCYACGHLDTRPELHTTLEKLIASVRDKSIVPPKPNTRLEKYVAAMAGVWDDELPEPITREDKILFEAASGEDVTLSGNPLILENCIGGKALKALHVYGKSTQDGTPSPDNPVPIVSAGDDGSVTVKVTGANVLEGTKPGVESTSLGVIFTPGENGVLITGASISISSLTLHKDTMSRLPRGIYYLTTKGLSASVVLNFFYVGKFTSDQQNQTVVLTKDVEYSLILQIQKGETLNTIVQISLTRAPITTYSPYHEQFLTLPTPNGLPGIPVSSGGNYTDENGRQWICDEVDLERGVRVQRVRIKALSPNIAWSHRKTNSGNNNFQVRIYNADVALSRKPCFCNILRYTGNGWDDIPQNLPKIYANDQEITISFPPNSEYSSLEAFKQLLTNVKSFIFYCLATPVETPLTPAEIAAYKSLTTYAPTTVLQATDGAGMEATYKCNVRKAEKTINDLYAELTAELEA